MQRRLMLKEREHARPGGVFLGVGGSKSESESDTSEVDDCPECSGRQVCSTTCLIQA